MKSFGRRLMWHVNRSPLSVVVKLFYSVKKRGDISERRRGADSIQNSSQLLESSKELEEQGYTYLNNIVSVDLLNELAGAADDKILSSNKSLENEEASPKQFWQRLLDNETVNDAFDAESVWVRFATQKSVIDLLSVHFKCVPQLMDVLLTYSQHTDKALSFSQLWHKDHDDPNVVKVFVYLSDVQTQSDGPFTFADKKVSSRFGFRLKSHMNDKAFFNEVGKDEIIEMYGKRLSVFACATSCCYHMGSRVAPEHSRLLYTATFIKPPTLFPRNKSRFYASSNLSKQQFLVLDIE